MPTVNLGTRDFFSFTFTDRYRLAIRASNVSFVITDLDDGSLVWQATHVTEMNLNKFRTEEVDLDFGAGDYDFTWFATDPDGNAKIFQDILTLRDVTAIPDSGTWTTVEQARIDARTPSIEDVHVAEAGHWVDQESRYFYDERERLEWMDAAHTRKNLRGRMDLRLLRQATAEMAAYFADPSADEEADEFIVSMARYRAAGITSVSQPGGLSVGFGSTGATAIDTTNVHVLAALAYISRLSRNGNRPVVTAHFDMTPERPAIPFGYRIPPQPGDGYPIRRAWR